mgnify:CR=1 FL=1
METIAVVLSVKPDQVEAFEAGFREHEVPIWEDYKSRGILVTASIAAHSGIRLTGASPILS